MDDKKLYRLATAAAEQAYAPYSGYRVGAAALTATGEVYCGANIENASYGATICAERVALSKAVFDGHREFAAIAVAAVCADDAPDARGADGADDGVIETQASGAAWPCGICRQFLFEFGSDTRIISGVDE
jgi:cytidine deaminase